jgi:hypothetical protein
MKRYSDEWWQGVKDFNNSFPINIFKKDKEIIMNPDILPTPEEWKLICKMVKQHELTDDEIKEVYGEHFDVKNCDWLHLECIRAILQKAREK